MASLDPKSRWMRRLVAVWRRHFRWPEGPRTLALAFVRRLAALVPPPRSSATSNARVRPPSCPRLQPGLGRRGGDSSALGFTGHLCG